MARGEALCFQKRNWLRTLSLLLCLVPLVCCGSTYHHYKTGYFLGNPEYLRYNLGATLTPLRVALAMLIRLWHLLGYLNLFVLTILRRCTPCRSPRDWSAMAAYRRASRFRCSWCSASSSRRT